MNNKHQNHFGAPPEDALPESFIKAMPVQYKALKVLARDAKKTNYTDAELYDFVNDGQLGFQVWDRETKTRKPMDSFSFVVFQVYAGVSGWNPDKQVKYYSSRSKHTQREQLVVWSSGESEPIAKGFYKDIKPALPKECHYTKFVKAYCLELDTVVEIELTNMVEMAMQNAVARAEQEQHRKKRPQDVFILTLPDNDFLWGFSLSGFKKVHGNGDDYTTNGDAFHMPEFWPCGVVDAQQSRELHDRVAKIQQEEFKAHELMLARNGLTPQQTIAPVQKPEGVVVQSAADTADPHEPAPDDYDHQDHPENPEGSHHFPTDEPPF